MNKQKRMFNPHQSILMLGTVRYVLRPQESSSKKQCSKCLYEWVIHMLFNYPAPSCISAANLMCKDTNIFRKPITSLKEILYYLIQSQIY
jgi:hypothetical protein